MDVPGFVETLRAVKVWAADPSLATLQRRTGFASSTLSDALSPQRRRLPALDLVLAVVRACGANPQQVAEWEACWRSVRQHSPGGQQSTAVSAAGTGYWIPRQLPSDIRGFVGRTDALQALDDAIDDEPTVVLVTGTAGVGKTALALHWAHRAAARFPDGQLYLDLRGHSEGPAVSVAEALNLLLQSLGVPGESIPLEQVLQTGLYRSVLAERQVLVILDNAHDAAQVRPLLPGSPGSRVLVTSRDALTGLVAFEGAGRIALDTLPEADAIQLLAAQVGAARVASEPEAVAALAGLCAHLPLALRIAAANLAVRPTQTLSGVVAELSSADLLSQLRIAGDPDSAVEAAFDLSYRGLSDGARRLFRLLGLMPGAETGRPAAAVLLQRAWGERCPELDELLAAHLLFEHSPGRYRMHDLLAHFASTRAEREEPEESREAALHRLMSWYVLTIDAATQWFLPGFLREGRGGLGLVGEAHPFSSQAEAMSWLSTELSGLTAAIHHAADHGPSPFAWHLANALRGYLYTRRLDVDFMAIGHAGLRAARTADSAFGQGLCHSVLGMSAIASGNPDAARAHEELAYQLFESIGHAPGMHVASNNLSDACLRRGQIRQAWAHAARAIDLLDAVPEPYSPRPISLASVAMLETVRGDHDAALGRLAVIEEETRRFGETHLTSTVHSNSGMIHLFQGDLEAAGRSLEAARTAAEHTGSESDLYDALSLLVLLHTHAGRYDQASADARTLEQLLDRGIHSYSGDDWAHTALLEWRLATQPVKEATLFGQEALALHLDAGHELVALRLRTRLGHAFAAIGDAAAARTHWHAALAYATEEELPDRHLLEWLLAR